MAKIVSEALGAIRSAHLERAREDNDYGHVESCEFAVEEAAEEFDRMIAEVRREAAEKALTEIADQWEQSAREVGDQEDIEFAVLCADSLRARAEAYRQERKEQ